MGAWDTIKATGAGMLGFGMQLTNLDMFFKVSVGFLTCAYLTLKIIELLLRWKNKGKSDE